ncbi:MAG: hypothetical protein EBS66_17330 [Betaproteobacteria bacterium]|nr:hypothetical protein [Betaproteobacteria bacterium]
MAAELITSIKNINPDGSILEVVIWKVPKPVPPTEHGNKYRAVYVVDGVRIVGFDNERGKGDHCHMDGKELPYAFTGVDQLLEDFIAALETRRAS